MDKQKSFVNDIVIEDDVETLTEVPQVPVSVASQVEEEEEEEGAIDDAQDESPYDNEEDDIQPINLQTDTHILTCFKAKRPFSSDNPINPFINISNDPPYYVLVDKRRPDQPVLPMPMTLSDVLEGVEIAYEEENEKQRDRHSELPAKIHVKLAGNPIGEINSQQINELNHFIAQWKDQLNLVSELSIISSAKYRSSSEVSTSGSSKFLTNLKKTIGLSKNDQQQQQLPPLVTSTSAFSHRSSLAEVESLAREMHKVSITELRDRQLISQRDKFLIPEDITVKAITWNVHGEKISSQNLDELLSTPSDIYIVCLQESDPLGKNLYANTATLQSTTDKLLAYLPDHIELAHNQLLGLMSIVLVHCRLAPQISAVELGSTGTGLFGVWGNKGAIVVKFTVGQDQIIADSGTQVVIVNCHLSAGAGTQAIDRRRWELSEISNKFSIDGLVAANDSVIFDSDAHELTLSDDLIEKGLDSGSAPPSGSRSLASSSLYNKPLNSPTSFKNDNSVVLLLGDLNYRVSLDPQIVYDFANRRDYETILIHDTLTQEIKSRRVLQEFKEGVIKFPPTYRYNIGEESGLEYDLDRIPSYTDRILYSSGDNVQLSQTDYSSHQSYHLSDHKPVSTSLRIKVDLVDFDKRNDIVTATLKKLDKAENAARPVIKVDPLEIISTGLVLHEQVAYTTITHSAVSTSQSSSRIIEWEIITSDSNIKATPEKGLLPAGGSQKIKLTTTLGVLNSGGVNTKHPLQRIVVIHIKDAQDIFVSVEFNALATCLGAPLDLLCRMPEGARNGIKDSSTSSNMPKEICNCIDYLWNHLSTKDLFWKSGDEAIETQIQEWMDNGQDFDIHVLDTANELQDNIGVYSVANQFLLLLRYISGGVIPAEYYYIVLRGAAGVNVLLESLTGINVNVLLYIVGFLAKAIDDGINELRLLDLFEPLLISVPRIKDSSKSRSARREFLKQLIDPS